MSHFTGRAVRVCAAGRIVFIVVLACASLIPSTAQAQALPSGWTGSDVGAPSLPGRALYSVDTFILEGAGKRIGYRADQFYYVYQKIAGDVTIIARVASIEKTYRSAKAGVMIRESLAADSRHAFALVTPAQGIGFHRRTTTGGSTAGTNLSGAAPVWLRLVRSGSTFTASQSTNGTSWTTIGTATISMASTVYVGLAVSSYDTDQLATAAFNNVTLSGQLPVGWSSADVGSPVPVAVSYSSAGFAVRAAGWDIGGTSDQFGFAYRQVSGDVDVVARTASLNGANAWSKAGLMVRSSLSANAAHSTVFVSSGNGVGFRSRPGTGLSTIDLPGGAGTAPAWLKLERRGSAVTAFRSSDGSSWMMIGSQTLTLPSTFYVGVAVTAYDERATADALFANVTVAATSSPALTPPTVSLTSPTAGGTFTAPATVALAATASDLDNGVAQVEFYANGILLATDTTSPYAFTWSGVPVGSYSLTAMARDTRGAVATSAARTITVGGSTNAPPSVSLTAPAAGSTYTAPASVALAASATDADGVASVEFYANGTLLGTDNTSPYAFTWSGAPAGTYNVTAAARDTKGAVATSAARSITVNTAVVTNMPPAVSLTAPAVGSTYLAPASVTISASAADTDGTIARVDFYAGSTLVGSDTTSPYSVTWSNAPAGSFPLIAVARDNAGATTTSASRSISISSPVAPTKAIFTASPDHATVTGYTLDVFTAGANPATALPIATQNLGKPAVVYGDCTVDIAATISGLPGGSYFATVVAVGSTGTSTRATSPTFAR